MQFKIVADSSADLLSMGGVDYTSVPLTITSGSKSYVDDANLDIPQMIEDLKAYKGRSLTACPGTGLWLDAFGDADEVICVTITSGLSGSYNAACVAAEEYMKAHPGRKAWVLDSLSAGPELALMIEKIIELHNQGLAFDDLCKEMEAYRDQHTNLTFSLESLRNLVNNGRVSPATAALAGLLNIRIVGIASVEGTLQPVHKCRGEKRTYDGLISVMREHGFKGGKVRIAHCMNEAGAQTMAALITAQWPSADIQVYPLRGLCSFYAEERGMLIGYEN